MENTVRHAIKLIERAAWLAFEGAALVFLLVIMRDAEDK